MKTLLTIALVLLVLLSRSRGASVVVQWSTARALWGLVDSLPAGTAAEGDGAMLQLGYFSEATIGNPFAGNWTVLSTGSIGDQGGLADGYFSINTTLEEGTFAQPAVGTPLGVRFFNGPTLASSSLYNTAVNDDGTGLWQAPADPTSLINLVLAKGPSVFEGISFQTSIPVPEPSVVLLGGMGVGFLVRRRRRMPL